MGWVPGGVARNFLDIRLFDSPFLAVSGGEEQDNGLLDWMKASTIPICRTVSFSFSIIDYKSLIYVHGWFTAYNSFP